MNVSRVTTLATYQARFAQMSTGITHARVTRATSVLVAKNAEVCGFENFLKNFERGFITQIRTSALNFQSPTAMTRYRFVKILLARTIANVTLDMSLLATSSVEVRAWVSHTMRLMLPLFTQI